jgi:diguanylate cyclase (GGDEF)-like protein
MPRPRSGQPPHLVSRLFAAPTGDPYAGADLDNARRLGTVLWLLGGTLGLALLPISPPTEALGGSAGWMIAGVNLLVTVVGAQGLARRRDIDFDQIYALAYLAVAQIALLEWLAGGRGTPYHQLYLLVVLYVAAVHPPRRVLILLVTVALADFAPLVYSGWDSVTAADIAIQLLLITAVTVLAVMLMTRVRTQRIALRSDGEFATKLARVDALTGLGNRRAFDEALQGEVAKARELDRDLLVMLGDVDRFKKVNDESGHTDGDRCLRQVASVIADTVRQGDACFRWGGDEFAVVLPGTELEEGVRIAERLEAAVTQLCTRTDGLAVTVTWGLSELEAGMTAHELVKSADSMLLARKREREVAPADIPLPEPH